MTKRSALLELVDKNQNATYSLHLRRNHERLNPAHLGILNLFRSSQENTVIVGDGYAGLADIASYTSKVDKRCNMTKSISKLKDQNDLSPEDEQNKIIRSALTTIDTARATGAPEACCNLLGLPHHTSTSTVKRIHTYHYLTRQELLKHSDSQNTPVGTRKMPEHEDIITVLTRAVKGSLEFNFSASVSQPVTPTSKKQNKPLKHMHVDRVTNLYWARRALHAGMSHKQYSQTYEATRRKAVPDNIDRHAVNIKERNKSKEIVDKQVVMMRRGRHMGADFIMDLKYKPSKPDETCEKYFLSALVLHIPHTSPSSLHGKKKSLMHMPTTKV